MFRRARRAAPTSQTRDAAPTLSDTVVRKLVAIGDRSGSPTVLVDPEGTIRYANAAAGALVGRPRASLEGTDAFSHLHPDDAARARVELGAIVAGHRVPGATEYRVMGAGGDWRDVSVSAVNLLDLPNAPGLLLTVADVTAQRAHEATLRELAWQDPITRLPNRRALEAHLARVVGNGDAVAVSFVDIDHFRRINDSWGHTAGDEVLRAVASRLSASLPPGAMVAHFSADTFVVVLSGRDAARAVMLLWELVGRVSTSLFVAQSELRLTATAGVAVGTGVAVGAHGAGARCAGAPPRPGRPGTTPESLLRDADAALTRGKTTRRGGVVVFTETMRRESVRRLAVESDLRGALARGELALHLQPVVWMATGEVAGAEALLRWPRPDGEVPPDLFIGVAEDTGLIGDVGAWVLERTVAALDAGRAQSCSVNLSPRELLDPALPARTAALLASRGVSPGRLGFEITETVVVENVELAVECLSGLRRLGCPIGLDDFGTGYSSLGYLRRLPIDYLKIDRVLVKDIDEDAQARRIVEAIVSLAGALALPTVAEGVERLSQVRVLTQMGSLLGQGWLLGRPKAVHVEGVAAAAPPPCGAT